MTYLMLKDAEGYPDGITLTTYKKGEVYDLPDILATSWVNEKVCAESSKKVTEVVETLDPHTVGAHPPADVQTRHHDLERGQTDAEAQHVDQLRTGSMSPVTNRTVVTEEKDDGEEEVKKTPSKPGPKETK